MGQPLPVMVRAMAFRQISDKDDQVRSRIERTSQGRESGLQPLRRRRDWLPLLIGPVGLLICVGLSRFDAFFQQLQNRLEAPAPFLVGLVAAIYLARFVFHRNALFLLLGVLATGMALREIHDLSGMHFMKKGIYVILGIVVVWGAIWRRPVVAAIRSDPRHTCWLAATFVAYLLAVLVMRRAFRFVPGEHHIHRSLEECAETVAHLMFLVTSLVASRPKPGKSLVPADASA